ncbi:MAG: hypothetical protein WBG41_03115 [Acidimicrobiales bacterium]
MSVSENSLLCDADGCSTAPFAAVAPEDTARGVVLTESTIRAMAAESGWTSLGAEGVRGDRCPTHSSES